VVVPGKCIFLNRLINKWIDTAIESYQIMSCEETGKGGELIKVD